MCRRARWTRSATPYQMSAPGLHTPPLAHCSWVLQLDQYHLLRFHLFPIVDCWLCVPLGTKLAYSDVQARRVSRHLGSSHGMQPNVLLLAHLWHVVIGNSHNANGWVHEFPAMIVRCPEPGKGAFSRRHVAGTVLNKLKEVSGPG